MGIINVKCGLLTLSICVGYQMYIKGVCGLLPLTKDLCGVLMLRVCESYETGFVGTASTYGLCGFLTLCGLLTFRVRVTLSVIGMSCFC